MHDGVSYTFFVNCGTKTKINIENLDFWRFASIFFFNSKHVLFVYIVKQNKNKTKLRGFKNKNSVFQNFQNSDMLEANF